MRTRFSLPILMTTDGERHAQLRQQVLPAFTRAALKSWQPMIDNLAVELVDKVMKNPGGDLIDQLAVPMPMRLMALRYWRVPALVAICNRDNGCHPVPTWRWQTGVVSRRYRQDLLVGPPY
jgi:hypothetical protein